MKSKRMKTKNLNIVVSLLLVLVLSMENFAVAVSDNDGSAFISKAEFDSLKSNFQAQIDQYNTSMDAKIDEAIASYLSGIRVSKESKVKLISDIDTKTGKGYRSRIGDVQNGGDPGLCLNNRDTADWILGNTSAICYREGWLDIDSGEVAALANSTGGRTIPSSQAKWYVPQGSYGTVTFTNGNYAIMPVATQVVSGSTKHKRSYIPMLYVDENGVVQEFSDARPLIIDMRSVRGSTGATNNSRWFYLAGVEIGEKPTKKIFDTNKLIIDLPIRCYNTQDTIGAEGFGYVYAVKKAATESYNPNIFCWNPTILCTAYYYKCEQVLVRGQVAAMAMTTDYEFTSQVNRLAWGQSGSGGSVYDASQTSMPYLSFLPAEGKTNLPADAWTAKDGFDYKRLKVEYLQLKDFPSITDPKRNLYTYEGLPLYSATKDGTLTFDIKIEKSKKESNGPNNMVLWDDPSSTMKIRVKDTPFKIDDDYKDCVKIKIGDNESTEGTIQADTMTTVKLNLKKGKTYYMRWYCDGYNYGGEIIFLGNAVETVND